MILNLSLTSPISVAMLLAKMVRSGRAYMLQSGLHPFSCPRMTYACIACVVFGLVLAPCPLRRAGGCAWHRLRASAVSRQACMWVMRGTMLLGARLLMIFVVACSIFMMTVMLPYIFSCGTYARRMLLRTCCSFLIGLMTAAWTEFNCLLTPIKMCPQRQMLSGRTVEVSISPPCTLEYERCTSQKTYCTFALDWHSQMIILGP